LLLDAYRPSSVSGASQNPGLCENNDFLFFHLQMSDIIIRGEVLTPRHRTVSCFCGRNLSVCKSIGWHFETLRAVMRQMV